MSGVHLWGFLRMRLSGRNPPCGDTGFARALEERRALGSSTAPVPWFWVPRGPAGVASELPFLRVARCFPVVVAFREALPEATEWWLQQVVDPSYRGPRRVVRRAQWMSTVSLATRVGGVACPAAGRAQPLVEEMGAGAR